MSGLQKLATIVALSVVLWGFIMVGVASL